MAWVDPEYAGEFAVVSAWLAGLLPWSVSLSSPGGGTFLSVRFPFFAVRLLFGFEVEGEIPFLPVWHAPELPQPGSIAVLAFGLWLAAAVLLTAALFLSTGYYAREATLEASAPVHPATVMGLLLTGGGVLLLGAALLLAASPAQLRLVGFDGTGYAGLTLPVGALIVPALGVVLLRTTLARGDERSPGQG